MATAATLAPGELLDALREVAAVLSDHAAALDRLEQGTDWDEAVSLDGSAPQQDDPSASTPGRQGEKAPGSDLAATLGSAVAAAAGAKDFTELFDRATSGARQRATGSAGRALGAVLGGLAEALRNADRLDGERFAIGLELAAERLAPRDDGSHAGCMPAVVAAAADGALAALDAGADLPDVVIAAADDGLAELESGPNANPRLVERGVVDAAAAGFLLVLDGLASVLTGEPLPAPPMDPVGSALVEDDTVAGVRYRISCTVEPNEGCGLESANWLESLWWELGEIERFEPFDERWKVRVVTLDPGAVVEAVFEVGRPRDLQIVAVAIAA